MSSAFLLFGLGNIGDEYEGTRHNIGFMVLDAIAKKFDAEFEKKRYAFVTKFNFKGGKFILIKPTTYVNQSGKAVKYYLSHEDLPLKNILVIADDIALPFGTLRMSPKGGAGGHNGMENIIDVLGSTDFPRLRFGVGNNFPKGGQTDYVLSAFDEDEKKLLPEFIDKAVEACLSFGMEGIERAMTKFNK